MTSTGGARALDASNQCVKTVTTKHTLEFRASPTLLQPGDTLLSPSAWFHLIVEMSVIWVLLPIGSLPVHHMYLHAVKKRKTISICSGHLSFRPINHYMSTGNCCTFFCFFHAGRKRNPSACWSCTWLCPSVTSQVSTVLRN